VFVAVASHGFLDALTDAGLGVGFFIPFYDARFFFPWRPILTSSVDPAAFFSERGATILANEMLWICTPVALGLAGLAWARRRAAGTQRARRAPDR
jgi:inner membrane protein